MNFTEEEYRSFFRHLRDFRCAGKIEIAPYDTPEAFESEEALQWYFIERIDRHAKIMREIVKSDIFQHTIKLPYFQSFKEKASTFLRMRSGERIENYAQFAQDIIKIQERKIKRIDSRANLLNSRINVNLEEYICSCNIRADILLDALEAVIGQKIEPTITPEEAKKAAAYIEKHQEEFIKHRETVLLFAKQQGIIDKETARIEVGKTMVNKMRSGILLSPELLRYIQKNSRYGTKNINAARMTGELIRNNKILSYTCPIQAVTELTTLVTPDLISIDTVSRYTKAVKKHPQHFYSYSYFLRKGADLT